MASKILPELKYTKEHEWASNEDGTIIVGITDFAQSSLGDIVFVELPEVGTKLSQDEDFGVVESIKSVSDLYAPIEGVVVEINQAVMETPELLNENPYEHWLLKVKVSSLDQFNSLLTSSDYKSHCE